MAKRRQKEPVRFAQMGGRGAALGVLTAGDVLEVEDKWPGLFDMSDPADPLIVRRCSGCGDELRFRFAGALPFMLSWIARATCERCAAKDREVAERDHVAAKFAERVAASRIPPSLAGLVSWESLIAKGQDADETAKRAFAIERAKAWSDGKTDKLGLLLYGPAGSGKTRLAATAAMTRLRREGLRWVSVGVLMAELQGAWNDEERQQALKVLTSAGAVVLDDFDKVNPTQNVRGQLFTALDKREQARSPLIVTTNLSPSHLAKLLNDPIVSRLSGMCEVLAYPGPDRRLEMGEGA